MLPYPLQGGRGKTFYLNPQTAKPKKVTRPPNE